MALIVLVLIRKMPALVELPEMEGGHSRIGLFARVWHRFARIDWKRWKRLSLTVLALIAAMLQRFFVRFAHKSERWAKVLQARVRHLSDLPSFERKAFPFSARIRKRAAFVEEERRLIAQLTANPHDVEAYRRLGNLYVIAGNAADARAAFSEILRLNPNDEEAQRRLRELSGSKMH